MLISHREADECILLIAYKIVAGDGIVVNYSVIDGFCTDGRFRGLEIARDQSKKLNYLRSPNRICCAWVKVFKINVPRLRDERAAVYLNIGIVTRLMIKAMSENTSSNLIRLTASICLC